jgi:hypothetical protein
VAGVLTNLECSEDPARCGRLIHSARIDACGRCIEGLTDCWHLALLVGVRALPEGRRRGAGRPLSVEDGMIAATCLGHGATLVTRDSVSFAGLGVERIDPWAAER